MKSTLTFIPLGGLANRFYAITSAISFSVDRNIRLRIVWFKDWGMGAGFHSIFELSQSFKQVEIIDATWSDYYILDRPRKKNLWIPYLFQRFHFDKCFYEDEIFNGKFSLDDLDKELEISSSIYLVQCECFYRKVGMFKLLRPNSYIQKLIDERIRNLNINEQTIGIHIRRTDHTDSIKYSPLSLFISKIDEEIKRNPSATFYVASDDLDEKRRLVDLYGNRIITTFDEVRRDNFLGIKDAVVELYTLAALKKIYGSNQSTFSQLAAQLFDHQLEILSTI